MATFLGAFWASVLTALPKSCTTIRAICDRPCGRQAVNSKQGFMFFQDREKYKTHKKSIYNSEKKSKGQKDRKEDELFAIRLQVSKRRLQTSNQSHDCSSTPATRPFPGIPPLEMRLLWAMRLCLRIHHTLTARPKALHLSKVVWNSFPVNNVM